MSDFYSTTPPGGGQVDSAQTIDEPSSTNSSKYTFAPEKCILLDVEVYPGRWCAGFTGPEGEHWCVDGDRDQLAEILETIATTGGTLVGYNIDGYDLLILRAVLAGVDDPYAISRQIVAHDGPDLPPELRDRANLWPRIKADVIDLAARTRDHGHFPALKRVAANLNCRHLQELPYDPTRPVTDAEWAEVKAYNRKDLDDTWVVLDHFTPELHALAALSTQYCVDLRNVHQAKIAQTVLTVAFHRAHGRFPRKITTPPSVRYRPPAPCRRPRNPVAAKWFDRLCAEEFPFQAGGDNPRPTVPEPPGTINIGGLELTVGSGGLHSSDSPRLHRATPEHELFEIDVASYYPSIMVQYGIFPGALGATGLKEYTEILHARLRIKDQAAAATDPAVRQHLKVQAHGLKIVLNSLFGLTGNPFSVLYDPTAFLSVTLTGQLLLLDLIARLDAAGATILSANTDGLFLKVRRDDEAWCKTLEAWESDTQMALETTAVATLAIEATNHYAVKYKNGQWKRRGNFSDEVDWKHVPAGAIIADAVVAALDVGTLPEVTVRKCADPAKFTYITRRERGKEGWLIDERTGTEASIGRLVRWYKARGSQLRIEYRWNDQVGKLHKTKPHGATSVQLLMDLPNAGQTLGDVDYGWYASEARRRVLQFADFPHLDPKWLTGAALNLHAMGLCPCPKWEGKKSPRAAKAEVPSYFWDWPAYDAFGTWTGPLTGLLVLDIDIPAKWAKYLATENPLDLDDCLVSYHGKETPAAVRAGAAKGKLIFTFAAEEGHPLARVGVAALRAATGCEIFYGRGVPTVCGRHPDGPEMEYLLDGQLGPAPDWLIADLTVRASAKLPKPKAKPKSTNSAGTSPRITDDGPDGAAVNAYGAAALEAEVAKVAGTPEGGRNNQLFASACAVGSLVAAGAIDGEEAAEQLMQATDLPQAEAAATINNGLARGAETPRDLNKLHKRPKIMITTEEYKVNRKAAHALRVDPALFQRGNMLVRVLRETATYYDEAGAVQPMDLCRDPGAPRIAPVPAALLREKLTRFARWRSVKVIKGEEVAFPAHPPGWAVDSLMHWGNWDEIRHLESIIETPVLRPDGTLLSAPGYDAATGLLLEPHAEFPAVAEEPTRADAVHAAHMLLDLVGDFPFAGPEHRAAWLAGLLTPLARFAIKGPVPLFVFDANMARVGKTKLVDVVSLIATGRKVARSACPATDEEWDKRLLAIAMAGTRLVLFDNLSTGGNLGSPSLDAALTGSSYAGRILGETAWASDIPFTTIMYASGNNLQLIGDITGRVVFTRMESRVDRPEERADFRVPDLLGHVRATRGELAVAALTILRGFVVAGRPAPNPPLPPLGEYAAWSALVRHAVHWATGLDPCATRELARSCDRLAQSLPALLVGWHRLCAAEGKSGLTTSEAIDALTANPQGHAALHAILAEQSRDGKLPPPQKLGNYLGRIRGRVCKGWAIKAKTVHGANSWTVTKIDPAAPDITEIDAEAPAE